MARPAQQSRTVLIEKLTAVFRRYGYDGASMSDLSAASSLSKASLYHHFPGGKQDMAAKVLGEQGKRLQRLVLSPLAGSHDAAALMKSLEGVLEFYQGIPPSCLMNSMLHGSGADLFGADIAAVVHAWQQRYARFYAGLSGDTGEGQTWATYALERIQGALVLCRVQHERQPLERCIQELRGDVLAARDS